MHFAKGHTITDERWRLELALAAVCRSFAPRAGETLAPLDASPNASKHEAPAPRYVSYYSYRYL
ncbi:hypothetical protein [Paraeggerthella hongkongensis]|uniref:Uncharacterized protein n=1 Tax=Paraeggerthella hongkongensis TaxID=230658 RepID=A0A3N0BHP3_9ACTN|nr:hypothetical protein [Paraeggerthella hongkongensis]RNL47076.1 hypothetical protein DMP08_03365 [Paraeggerthella hongkongensis]